MKLKLATLMRQAGSRNVDRFGHAFADGFAARHPKMAPHLALVHAVRDVDVIPRLRSEAEATAPGYEIHLSPKFYALDAATRDAVFAHEVGHVVQFHYTRDRSLRFVRAAEALGIDPWDTLGLPYGAFNMDEAFADAFMEYHLRGDLFRRFPAWVPLVEAVQDDRDPQGARHA